MAMQSIGEVQQYDQGKLLAEVDPEGRLEEYFRLLAAENSRINLVSRETLPAVVREGGDQFAGLRRLAAESLYPLAHVELTGVSSYLDIGSGGGFPALPVVLTVRPEQGVMVERTLKKAAALGRMVTALGCPVRVEPVTFEELTLPAESFDLVTLRLVRLTGPMLKKIVRVLRPTGVFVYYAEATAAVDANRLSVVRVRYSGTAGGDIHTATVIRRNH